MCGISAYFNFRQTKKARNGPKVVRGWRTTLEAQLESSVESMRHRGPDAKGVWISSNNNVGLGHVRLSTRDLTSAGNQPLHSGNEGDDIHVVVNGELYFDPSLRTTLEKEYSFQSASDSEMAIALYRKYGVNFVEHLRGEFALVLYDGKKQMLMAARDRFGVKPLHYSLVGGQLLLATQCKGIVELLDSNELLHWDAQCLAQGGGHYGNRTLFEGIRKFPSGHILVVRQGQDAQLTFTPYFHPKYVINQGGQDARHAGELIEGLRQHLFEAVRFRLESTDVPVGILLSGGVDSSAVAGMVAQICKEHVQNGDQPPMPPRCFTIGFPEDDELDESATATRTAAHLSLPIDKVVISESALAEDFEEACWLGETLMWDLQHIAKKILSRHISACNFKVVLNGDGSDELFAGYPFFVAARLSADDEARATALQSGSTARRQSLQQTHAENVKWFGVEGVASPHENAAGRALGLPAEFCKLAIPRYDSWLKDEVRILNDPFQAMYECFSETELKELATYHPLHRAMFVWSKTALPNMVIAAISDGAEMAHGVESRPPFLDHVVAQYAQSLPVDMLVHLDGDEAPIEKWIFREAVKPFVTDEVYAKRKHAFAAPFRWARNGPIYNKLTSLITRENIEMLGFVDWDKCKDIVDMAYEGDQVLFRQAIWLAQLTSVGLQFGVERWESKQPDEMTNGLTNDATQLKESVEGLLGHKRKLERNDHHLITKAARHEY